MAVALPGWIDQSGPILVEKNIIPVLPIRLGLIVSLIVLRIVGSTVFVNKTGLIVVPLSGVDVKPRFEFAGIVLLFKIGHRNIGDGVVLSLRKLPLIPLQGAFGCGEGGISGFKRSIIPCGWIIGILEKPLVRLIQLGLPKPPDPIDFNFPKGVDLVVAVQLHIPQLSFTVLNRGVLELLIGRQRRVQSFVGKLEVCGIRSLLVEDHIDRHPLILFRLDSKIHQPPP